MKNRNDAGNLHFDESTRESLRIVKFRASKEIPVDVTVAIPLTIFRRLNSADFDEIQAVLPQWYKEHFTQAVMAGVLDSDLIKRRIGPLLSFRAVGNLYQKFIIAQARDGNEAWAAPPTMTEIGPPPEEDEAYNVGNGRLM